MDPVAPSSFVLKVNISCHRCEREIEKVIQNIPGVSTIIDAKQGRVTVSGSVDPQTVIRKLRKAGKIAELLVEHNPRAPAVANHQNLQIISRSEVDVRNPRHQAVVVDPVLLVASMAQVLNGIEHKKTLEVTRDGFKMSFFDHPSGKYGDTSRGSGGGGGTSRSSGGNTTSIRTSISSGGGGTTSIRSVGGGGTIGIHSGGGGTTNIRTSISSGGGGTTRIHSGGGGGTTSFRTSTSSGGGSTTSIRSGSTTSIRSSGGGTTSTRTNTSSDGSGTTSIRSSGGRSSYCS